MVLIEMLILLVIVIVVILSVANWVYPFFTKNLKPGWLFKSEKKKPKSFGEKVTATHKAEETAKRKVGALKTIAEKEAEEATKRAKKAAAISKEAKEKLKHY